MDEGGLYIAPPSLLSQNSIAMAAASSDGALTASATDCPLRAASPIGWSAQTDGTRDRHFGRASEH